MRRTNDSNIDPFDIMENDFYSSPRNEESFDNFTPSDANTEYLSQDEIEDDINAPGDPFMVHNALKLIPNPKQEDIIKQMDLFRSGNDQQKKEAYEYMMGVLSAYMVKLIKEKYGNYMRKHMDEMMQQGYLGIIKGMRNYDPKKGKPTTWFIMYINHEIQSYLNEQVHYTTQHYNTCAKKVKDCIRRKQEKGISYNIGDIYRETDVPIRTINKILKIEQLKFISLDDEENKFDIPSEYADPLAYIEEKEEKERLYKAVYSDYLTDEERKCFLERVLTGRKTMNTSFPQVARRLGLSKHDVQKNYWSACKKLKELLTNNQLSETKSKRKEKDFNTYISGEQLSFEDIILDQDEINELFTNEE